MIAIMPVLNQPQQHGKKLRKIPPHRYYYYHHLSSYHHYHLSSYYYNHHLSSYCYCQKDMHALDLPNLRSSPKAEDLLDLLKLFEPKKATNFDQHEEDSFQGIDNSGLFNWLTRIVSSDLSWIDDEAMKDEIWNEAGKRMAERCGRTAAPTRTREIIIEGTSPIELIEPALTEDNLGFKTWGSSLVLSRRLVREPELLHGKVLELGSGTGLVAILAQRLGADLVATDLPEIVPNLRTNLENNVELGGSKEVRAETLDWNNPEDFDQYGKFDTIIVSDPVYSHDHPILVCDTIKVLLNRNGAGEGEQSGSRSRVIVQLPQREKYEDVRQLLYDRLKLLGLKNERFEIEGGEDEFGKSDFAWSLWGW